MYFCDSMNNSSLCDEQEQNLAIKTICSTVSKTKQNNRTDFNDVKYGFSFTLSLERGVCTKLKVDWTDVKAKE